MNSAGRKVGNGTPYTGWVLKRVMRMRGRDSIQKVLTEYVHTYIAFGVDAGSPRIPKKSSAAVYQSTDGDNWIR